MSFINVSESDWTQPVRVNLELIEKTFGKKLVSSNKFVVQDLWNGEVWENDSGLFEVNGLAACDCVVLKVSMQ